MGVDATRTDVGCGVGRLAVGLTEVLGAGGRYEGFDIVPDEIAWCRRAISPRFPQFHFQVADVRNDAYRPDAATPASAYRFPFPDRAFDLAIAASVFTHLLAPECDNYLRELARVLKPLGRAVVSFYLLNDDTRAHVAAGRSVFQFTTPIGEAMVNDASRPSWAVAHDENRVRRLVTDVGFEIAARARVGVLLDHQARGGVLHEHRAQSLAHAARAHDVGQRVGELVQAGPG